MKKKLLFICFLSAMCMGVSAQSASVDGSEVSGKFVKKIEFPNNGANIKITYSDNSVAENLDLSEVKISFDNIADAISFLNADKDDQNAPIYYYDMQGRRLQQAPEKGLFIMKKGSEVVKVLNK